MSLTIASILAESAVRHADRTAVVLGDLRLTYAQLWGHAKQYAAVLRENGIGRATRSPLLLPNTPHFPLGLLGTLALGGVAVPVHALLKAGGDPVRPGGLRCQGAGVRGAAARRGRQGRRAGRRAGARVMDGGDATLTRIDTLALSATPIDALVPREPEDTAVILYTSGTTGTPKGAEITHLNVTMNVVASAMHSFDIDADDVVLGCLPLFHTFGQTCCMNTAFYVGASVVLLPRFDGAQALELLTKEKCTIFMGVPTMYIGLLEAAKTSEHRPTLKSALSGGAALPVPVLEQFAEVFGTQVLEGYGLTETSRSRRSTRSASSPSPAPSASRSGASRSRSPRPRSTRRSSCCRPASSARSSCAATTSSRAT
jgi:long-chain acyl-CoA synthetase